MHTFWRRLTRFGRQDKMPADGETFLFTSESVNEGHPDKLCDQARAAASAAVPPIERRPDMGGASGAPQRLA